jgi:hypothetical protein
MAGMRVDTGRCAHDSIGSETVVIDTSSGELLMITGFGSTLWDALADGIDEEGLVDEVARRYDSDAAAAVTELIGSLRDRGFVVESDDVARELSGWPDTFVAPRIESYDEIAEIMTMDPIHDVDVNLGWPSAGGEEHQPPSAT